MAHFGLRDLGDTHGAGSRIVAVGNAFGGNVLERGLSSAGILRETQTDYDVELQPVQLANGTAVADTYAICRTDTGKPFGGGRCVGKDYLAYQNHELVDFGQSIIDAAGGEFAFEAGGSLKGGAISWYQARLPDSVELRNTPLGSDRAELYLFLLTSHDGSISTTAQFGSHRLFCNNQIAATLRGGVNRVRIRHTSKMHDRMNEAGRVLRGALGFFETHVQEMRELDKQAMRVDEMREFAEKLIGDTEDAIAEADRTITDVVRNRRVAQRDRIVHLFNNGLGNVGRSRFDALQAVTEFSDHHRRGRSDESRLAAIINPADTDIKGRALRLLR